MGVRTARPNLLVILADDLGYSDLGCFGGEMRTPNLDALAADGLRFTRFANTPRCSPSRASLLTGLAPHQCGIGVLTGRFGEGDYEGNLNGRCATIAEVLGAAGYRCYAVGKWHLTDHDCFDQPNGSWPCERGFHRYWGTLGGVDSYYWPRHMARDLKPADVRGVEDFFYTDAIGEEAGAMLRRHAAEHPGVPFFQFIAFTAPHWPLHARDEDIARCRGRFDAGWDALREARRKRMIGMGLIDGRWRLTARDPSVPPWTELPEAGRAWQLRRMEVYAAQVESMDRAAGRVIETLKATGQFEDTLILFLSDNGGCAEEMSTAEKPGRWKLGETRSGGPVRLGNDPGLMPGPENTYQSYGVPWANVSNTPFRMYKHWTYEGGIATPFLAHWPAGIAGRGGLRAHRAWLPDIMATALDLAGAEYPSVFRGNPLPRPEGVSLRPAFDGRPLPERIMCWEHEGNAAALEGEWKLLLNFSASATGTGVNEAERGDWELYDLAADPTETRNIASRHPDRLRRMIGEWEAWAARVGVIPREQWLDALRKASQ